MIKVRSLPLVQQKLLTFITAHEFTQPCSILSLNSDTMGAPSAAETSYLYHSTWVHSALFSFYCTRAHIVSLFKDNIEQGWVNSCAVIKVRSFCCTRVQSCLWTVTRWVPLVQQKLLTFIIAHEFTQPCSILSLNVGRFCCTRGTHRVTVQRQDWTRLSELMCCDKGKKFLLH
jgi:hypothetical protein